MFIDIWSEKQTSSPQLLVQPDQRKKETQDGANATKELRSVCIRD